MKTVILCGGMGTRMKEETDFKPKPMVEIGNKPILYHIMRRYMKHNYRDFVLCLGYKGEMIRRYFFEYPLMTNPCTISNIGMLTYHANPLKEDDKFDVTLCDTGLESQTGERLWRVRDYLKEPIFLCTYGDGLSDVNIQGVVDYHKAHGKLATCVAVQPQSKYGVIVCGPSLINDDGHKGQVASFNEKPKSSEWVNAGFFVFNRSVLDRLTNMVQFKPQLEHLLGQLAEDEQLMTYKHDGFFHSCDTSKDLAELNQIWDTGDAPWK